MRETIFDLLLASDTLARSSDAVPMPAECRGFARHSRAEPSAEQRKRGRHLVAMAPPRRAARARDAGDSAPAVGRYLGFTSCPPCLVQSAALIKATWPLQELWP